jgi:hypothetical protein
MTLLNAAEAIYLGDRAVDRVYKGATQVWPSEGPPVGVYAAWGDSENATIDDRTLTWGGAPFAGGFAISDAVLSGKQRWQMMHYVDYTADPEPQDYYTASGIWSRVPEDYWGGSGIFHSAFTSPLQPAGGISTNPGYTPFVTNGEWGAAIDADLSLVPFYWYEYATLAYMVGADYIVEIWARQVWVGGVSEWLGGGDPVTETDPTSVLSSANPFRVGASVFYSPGSQVTLLHPDDYLPTPAVAGYATGIAA